MVRKRYTNQKKQEQVSRKQFEAFLEAHEWITGDIDPDLGEDILVRIYRDGVSTGLSLYVQLKSTKDIAAHQLATGEISYSFDTDDLGHWEVQTPMVFLVIWDTSQSTGWWISVKDAIVDLDRNNPDWQKQSSVAVHISFENRVDEYGLERIKDMLAQLYGPVIGKDKEIVINAEFVFPPTPEGRGKLEALKRMMATGDGIKLEGQYIQEFSLPDWWTRIYGKPDPKNMVLWMGSTSSEEILPMQIEFYSEWVGTTRIPYVEFRRVKQGFEEVTLSNKHQNLPFDFSMVISSKEKSLVFSVKAKFDGLDGQSALQLATIAKTGAEGGYVQITDLKTRRDSKMSMPPGTLPPPEPQFLRFVENLAIIQEKTGKALLIPDIKTLTLKQMREAEELASIIKSGRYTHVSDYVDFDLPRPAIAMIMNDYPKSGNLYLRIGFGHVDYDLLAQKFSLGPCVTTYCGKLAYSYEELLAWYEQAGDKDYIKIRLISPEITDEYQNWPAKLQG